MPYDLVVLGSGPAGQRAAVQGAKLGKKVCIVEAVSVVGGVCTNTGTIPSKSFRHAVMHLTGFRERGIYGAAYAVKQHIEIADLLFRVDQVVAREIDVIRAQLGRNGINVLEGVASFDGPHQISIDRAGSDGQHHVVEAEKIVIATGSVAARPSHLPFDGQTVIVSDDILKLKSLPHSICIIGAGVIGVEYATMFAALGTRVTIVDKRERLLPFVDHEISDALAYHLQDHRVVLRLHEEVETVEISERNGHRHADIKLKSGKNLHSDIALFTIGRTGATEALNLEKAGISVDDRGRLTVNQNHQTNVEHIYAVGDVVGFPALASTSMEQGRQAVLHAFKIASATPTLELFPYGIYTVPEISMVGATEEELTAKGLPYEIGKSWFRELARGQIAGDSIGMLKLIFHPESRHILGVHVIGEGATEIVHIGLAVMANGGTIDWLADAVFNYPTMAEAYKVAALNGINRLTE